TRISFPTGAGRGSLSARFSATIALARRRSSVIRVPAVVLFTALALAAAPSKAQDEDCAACGCQGGGQQQPSISFDAEQPATPQNAKIEAKGTYLLGGNQIDSIKLKCAPPGGGKQLEKAGVVQNGKWNGEIKPVAAG